MNTDMKSRVDTLVHVGKVLGAGSMNPAVTRHYSATSFRHGAEADIVAAYNCILEWGCLEPLQYARYRWGDLAQHRMGYTDLELLKIAHKASGAPETSAPTQEHVAKIEPMARRGRELLEQWEGPAG